MDPVTTILAVYSAVISACYIIVTVNYQRNLDDTNKKFREILQDALILTKEKSENQLRLNRAAKIISLEINDLARQVRINRTISNAKNKREQLLLKKGNFEGKLQQNLLLAQDFDNIFETNILGSLDKNAKNTITLKALSFRNKALK